MLRPAQAADGVSLEAINKAGRQRMLTQRIVKLYVQVGMQVDADGAKRRLEDSLYLFEAQLGELRSSIKDESARAALGKVQEQWGAFKARASGPVTRDGARELNALGEGLLEASHAAVEALETKSGSPVGKLVNIAGRQRMLSQRYAKLYLMRLWGVEAPKGPSQMDTARSEFVDALDALREAPQNTRAIREELGKAELQWAWFQNAIAMEGAMSFSLVVADAAEAILESLELVTQLYSELPSG